jgi:hypothetical protein
MCNLVAGGISDASIGTVHCWPHTGRQSGMITRHNLATDADRTRLGPGAITIWPRMLTGSGPKMRVVIAASSWAAPTR